VYGRGVVSLDTPVLRADDLGVQRGDGVFETARFCDGRVFKLGLHLERLVRSASRLSLSLPSAEEWRSLVADAVAAYGAGDGLVKLVCTRGVVPGGPVTAYALALPIPPEVVRQRTEGVDVVTLSLGVSATARAESPWLLGGAKTLSYAVSMASLRTAAERGGDDAIWVASGGEVLEAPTATVCWVSDGALRTAPTASGILAGTTLAVVAALAVPLSYEVREATVPDLLAADEVMLVSSVRGVAGVRRIDGTAIGTGEVGEHSARLRDAFEDAVAGRLDVPAATP
jgi:4-amino-4-deoxychorismate lyase